MEIRQLKTFLAIIERGTVTAAAEQLGYAQSTVTHQLQMLEDDLGVKLFERLGRSIYPRREAERLLPYARQIIKNAVEAEQAVADFKNGGGALTVGTVESLLATKLSRLLEAYHLRHPEVELVVKPGTCAENLAGILTNMLDVAFLIDREIGDPEYFCQILATEPVIFIAGQNCPLSREPLTPDDLRHQKLILTGKGCPYRNFLDHLLYERNIVPQSVMEIHNVQTVKQFAAIGLGLAFLPKTAAQAELDSGRLLEIPWEGPQLAIYTQLVYHREKWLNPPLHNLLTLARDHMT